MTATNQIVTAVDSVGREEHGSETIKKPASEEERGQSRTWKPHYTLRALPGAMTAAWKSSVVSSGA